MTIILAVHTLFFILLTSCSIVSPAPIPLFSKSGSAPIKESDVVNVPKTHNRTVHPFESIIPSQANSTSVVESGCQDNAADDSELPVVPSLGKRFSGGGGNRFNFPQTFHQFHQFQPGSAGTNFGLEIPKGGKHRH